MVPQAYITRPEIIPVSLDGASTGVIDITGREVLVVQYAGFSNPDYYVHFRTSTSDTVGGNTLDTFNASGFIRFGGTDATIVISPGATEMYLHWMLTDATGSAQNGGANDYIYIRPMAILR